MARLAWISLNVEIIGRNDKCMHVVALHDEPLYETNEREMRITLLKLPRNMTVAGGVVRTINSQAIDDEIPGGNQIQHYRPTIRSNLKPCPLLNRTGA